MYRASARGSSGGRPWLPCECPRPGLVRVTSGCWRGARRRRHAAGSLSGRSCAGGRSQPGLLVGDRGLVTRLCGVVSAGRSDELGHLLGGRLGRSEPDTAGGVGLFLWGGSRLAIAGCSWMVVFASPGRSVPRPRGVFVSGGLAAGCGRARSERHRPVGLELCCRLKTSRGWWILRHFSSLSGHSGGGRRFLSRPHRGSHRAAGCPILAESWP